jgi:alpha-L-fucosidase
VIEAFFTTKGGNLYAILPGWPGKEFVIHDVASAVGVTLLGTSAPLRWQREGNGIRITMPDFPSQASDAYTLRVTGAR